MNLKLIWINILNPVFIKNEIKRKKIQIIIFFFINFGLTYSLGLLLYYNKFIDPENFASFMMILPLSSVAIAKFYTEGLNNDMYEFYSLIILFFLIYSLLIVLKLLNLINNNEFINEVENKDGLVVVDFFATWCGPCKMLTPVLESIDNEMENIKVVKVDIDESRRLAMNYGIQSVPTIKIFKDGREVVTRVGFQPKETLENIIQMIM